jgi:glycosyltransferase involved in cell wall biosynthesis
VALARLEKTVDSVYFLMYEGFHEELESNRWHYARRWAQHFPVTLLQPRQRFGRRTKAVGTPAIENCEVLSIAKEAFSSSFHVRGMIQAAQVMEHMSSRGHRKPLLWCYNAGLATLYAALPAAARVYHASENYFDFEGQPELFYREVEATLRLSDLVIPVSSGVAEGIRSRIPEARLALVTNGCDAAHYKPVGPGNAMVERAGDGFDRVAVFAGNINGRLDFELVERAANANPATLIVFVGPVGSLNKPDRQAWRRILRLPNVRSLRSMAPTDLAAVYRVADVGFIPYRRDPWLMRNGFPLKTLEMAASGLPLVSSHMEPIIGLASGIVVAEDDDRFLETLSSLSRATLTDGERLELVELAAQNDYDRKFAQVVAHVADAIPDNRGSRTQLDDLLVDLGHDSWLAACMQVFRVGKPNLAWRAVLVAYEGFARIVPAETRHRLIPAAVRSWARSRVGQ